MNARVEWSITRLDHVLREVQRPVRVVPDQRYREIGVRSHGRGIFHKEPVLGRELGEKNVFWIKPGDLVFNIVFAWERAVAVASRAEDGFIGSHRFPTFVPSGAGVNLRFLMRFFSTEHGSFILEQNSPGAAGRNKTLNRRALMKEKIPLPPLSLQRAIADFLDKKTAAIDALIAKKERLIELLQEKRQALITQAVTKGLDPAVPMKDSGIEWLGEIPAHWEVRQVRHCLKGIEQGWSPECENRPAEEHEWGVLKAGCVNGWQFRSDENKALPAATEPRPRYEIRAGDLLMSRANTRDLLGSTALVRDVRPRLLLCDKIYRLAVDTTTARADYLELALSSKLARTQMEQDATGASGSMQNIGQDTVRRIMLALPSVTEQEAVVVAVRASVEKIKAVEKRALEAIACLREYRQALITAAVTGKLDVTKHAADPQAVTPSVTQIHEAG